MTVPLRWRCCRAVLRQRQWDRLTPAQMVPLPSSFCPDMPPRFDGSGSGSQCQRDRKDGRSQKSAASCLAVRMRSRTSLRALCACRGSATIHAANPLAPDGRCSAVLAAALDTGGASRAAWMHYHAAVSAWNRRRTCLASTKAPILGEIDIACRILLPRQTARPTIFSFQHRSEGIASHSARRQQLMAMERYGVWPQEQ